jgi:hypothetical protein
METEEKYEEMREVIQGQLNVAEGVGRMGNYNIAGLILTELELNYGVVTKQLPSDEDWDAIGSKYVELAFGKKNTRMNMDFLNWLKTHFSSPRRKPVNVKINEEETKKGIENAKSMHGYGYTYERREGTEVELSELKPNQQVCYGGKDWHILMTEKLVKIQD